MFAKRLRKLRKEKGINQTELGNILGLSTSAIGMYEQGRRTPDQETLKKIADFFDVSIDYLLGRTDDRKPPEKIEETTNTNDIDARLTKKDKRDIAKELEKLMDDIEHSDGLSAYNNQLTDEQKELIKNALEIALKVVKIKNKEKYTPKKYRKE